MLGLIFWKGAHLLMLLLILINGGVVDKHNNWRFTWKN